jgi:predicted DNA-binding transcriptional regulator YafY
MRRCLDILLRLLREPSTTDELHRIILTEADREQETTLTEKALQRRFDEDKRRLQDWFKVELRYDRSTGTYMLNHIGSPLIDLSDQSLRTFAFLEQIYSDDEVPMAVEVRTLLRTIQIVLSQDRLKDLQNIRGLLEIELGVADNDEIDPDVWDAVKISTSEHRRLEFDYNSPSNTSTRPHRHQVEPLRYFFDTVRKHYYLECFGISSTSSQKGIRDQRGKLIRFRLGRIKNPRVLPMHFPANRRIPTKELIYELDPVVARLGVTRHFPDMQIYPRVDGGAKVVVASHNLFFDLRTLLHYGGNCKVIGGDEAVREMKTLVQTLHQRYVEEDIE